MNIDLQTITQLRVRTGAGIADCQSALKESGGDIDQAIESLRKKGAIKASKKADRATTEGLIAIAKADGQAAVVALACETDFVSKNEDFIAAVAAYAQKLLTADPVEFKNWAEEAIRGELVVKIGENIQLDDFGVHRGVVVGAYLHANKKSAAVAVLTGGSMQLANDIALQVVAMSPKYLAPENIPVGEIEKEKEIYREQLAGEGKPAEMIEKILVGKLNKYYEDICLLNQLFVKDDSKKISDLLKAAGENVAIRDFKKYQV